MNRMAVLFAMGVSIICCQVSFALNYETAKGVDIVNENATKGRGYSTIQIKKIQKELAGKVLTFENGELFGVSKDLRGALDLLVFFTADASKGLRPLVFNVKAKITDPTTIKWAENLDIGVKIKTLTGTVASPSEAGAFFTLANANIIPETMPSNKPLFDSSTVTGWDIVNGNATKKRGYTTIQNEKIQEGLAGKALTFEKGELFGVSKDLHGALDLLVFFTADASKGLRPLVFNVKAKITDPTTIKWAENLDIGVKIKTLTGTVASQNNAGMFFTLLNPKIVLEE